MHIQVDLSESNIIFIHTALDDAGLSAPAFRVFVHLSLRAQKGDTYPDADSMAAVCHLDRTTIFRALVELETRGMLLCEKRPGCSALYTLTPPSKWLAKRDAKDIQ
jgi:hypothetical protein